jgi:hypothetical protein
MKNLVIAIIPKKKLLIPPPLRNIRPKYSSPRDDTQRNSHNIKADHNLYNTSVSYQSHSF